MTFEDIKKYYQKQQGQKERVEKDLKSLIKGITKDKRHLKDLNIAKEIIRIVGLETQKQLQYHISDITSLALDSVFANPYKLVLNFEERRGKTECDILFERNGEKIKPKESAGFGSMDVASFALRIVSWSMSTPKTRKIIILDEPFRNLGASDQKAASMMVNELAKRLNLQIIMSTHKQLLVSEANRTISTKLKGKVTKTKIT